MKCEFAEIELRNSNNVYFKAIVTHNYESVVDTPAAYPYLSCPSIYAHDFAIFSIEDLGFKSN